MADAIHRSEGKRPIFPEHSIIIVDEAHKLPETAQQMLGVTLAAEEIRNLMPAVQSRLPNLSRQIV